MHVIYVLLLSEKPVQLGNDTIKRRISRVIVRRIVLVFGFPDFLLLAASGMTASPREMRSGFFETSAWFYLEILILMRSTAKAF